MSLTYEWKLTGLKKTDGNNLTDAIVQTYWTCTGTDSGGVSGMFSGATPFDINAANSGTFVAYEDLTEATILGWIKALVVGEYKNHVDSEINKQILLKNNLVTEVNDGSFPWNPPK